MKLIYSKGACSLAVHVLLEEMGIAYEREAVSLKDKTQLESYSPKSYVPLLILENGDVLTEAICILQYLAEKDHRLDLIGGAPGSMEKFRCIEWLEYVSTEIHKSVSPLFRKDLQDPFKTDLIKKTERRLKFMDDKLSERLFLTGEKMTIADMYAIANLRIVKGLKFDLSKFPNIMRYMQMMDEVPSVKRATEQEEADVSIGKRPSRAPLTETDLASMGLS